MTGSDLIVDTNIIIDLLKKKVQVAAVIAKAGEVYVPLTVLGELYVGIFRSSDPQEKTTEIQNFLATCIIMQMDEETATRYASIKAALLKKGKPIPENDMWIAAATLQYDLPLYTFDNHFKEVDGLQLFNPLSSI